MADANYWKEYHGQLVTMKIGPEQINGDVEKDKGLEELTGVLDINDQGVYLRPGFTEFDVKLYLTELNTKAFDEHERLSTERDEAYNDLRGRREEFESTKDYVDASRELPKVKACDEILLGYVTELSVQGILDKMGHEIKVDPENIIYCHPTKNINLGSLMPEYLTPN